MSDVGSKHLFSQGYLLASVAERRRVLLVSTFLPLASLSGRLRRRFRVHKSTNTPCVLHAAELTHVALIRSLDWDSADVTSHMHGLCFARPQITFIL